MEITLENGISLKLNEENHTAAIIPSPNAQNNIFIPKTIQYQSDEYIIDKISKESFKDNKNIRNFSFSKDSALTEIGKKAFLYSSLQNIEIPPHVQQIGAESFSFCENLNNITFSEHSELEIINKESFSFTPIEQIEIPKKVTILGECSFANCNKLTSIKIPKDSELRRICKASFSHTKIQSLFIPSKVETLENGWCSNTSFLNEISVSKNNDHFTLYENELILGKADDQSIHFDTLVFACRDIKQVTIPSQIKRIEPFCFDECNKLKMVNFSPDSQLTSIEQYAFYNTSIEEISIPSHVNRIGNLAFFDINSLTKINFSENSQLKSIEKGAFLRTSIESLSLQSNVKFLEDGWCCSTSNLNSISVSPLNKNFILFEKKIILGKSDKKKDVFDCFVFACRNIKKVKIPSNIKRINSYCFDECIQLESIEFSPNSELEAIDQYSFYSTSIKSILIPSKVNIIKMSAFLNCNKLKYVSFSSDNSELEIKKDIFNESFKDCCNLISIEFIGNEFYIGNNIFGGCSQIFVASFPNSKKITISDDIGIISENFSLFVDVGCTLCII